VFAAYLCRNKYRPALVLKQELAWPMISIDAVSHNACCPVCGPTEPLHTSRRRLPEFALLVLLIRPLRCRNCFRRFYRFALLGSGNK
jgi:hypothetical protein